MKRGFTLAEVLITLSIVGVVATMTIPTVMQKIQNKQYSTKLKKVYTNLNQAVRLELDGNDRLSDISSEEFLTKYFKIAHNCGKNANDLSCFAQDYSSIGANRHGSVNYVYPGNRNGLIGHPHPRYNYRVVLQDGTSMGICKISYSRHDNSANGMYEIYVDVNGLTGPNIVGRDMFKFILYNDGFIAGADNSTALRKGVTYNYGRIEGTGNRMRITDKRYCTKKYSTLEKKGFEDDISTCTEYLIYNNWEMDY